MAFTLWTLFEATLLCLNAICVLHEERFLMKMGWGVQQNIQGFGEPPTVKSQMLNLLRSIRTVVRCEYTVSGRPRDAQQRRAEQIKKIPSCYVISEGGKSIPLIFLNILTIIIKLILG